MAASLLLGIIFVLLERHIFGHEMGFCDLKHERRAALEWYLVRPMSPPCPQRSHMES